MDLPAIVRSQRRGQRRREGQGIHIYIYVEYIYGSIYGSLKKRMSSTPSGGKSCVNLTPANDGPGYVNCAREEVGDSTQPRETIHTVKR